MLGSAGLYISKNWIFGLLLIAVVASNLRGMLVDGPLGWIIIAAFLGVLIVSVLIHEALHALVAWLFGHQVHSIVISLWGGATTHTTLRARSFAHLCIALAGPLANLGLAALGFGLQPLMLSDSLALIFSIMGWINLVLGLFNLLPGYPLDGGQAVAALVWAVTGNRTTGLIVAGWLGRVCALGVLFYYLWPTITSGQSINLARDAWVILIAGMLFLSAGAPLRAAKSRRRMDQIMIGDALLPAALVAPETSVQAAYDAHPDPTTILLTARDGKLLGWLAPQPVEDTSVPVGSLTLSLPDMPIALDAKEPVTDLAQTMLQRQLQAVPVALPDGLPRILTLSSIGTQLHRIPEDPVKATT